MARMFACLFYSTLVFSFISTGLAATAINPAALYAGDIRVDDWSIFQSPDCQFMQFATKHCAAAARTTEWSNMSCPFEACFDFQGSKEQREHRPQTLPAAISNAVCTLAEFLVNVVDQADVVQSAAKKSLPDTLSEPFGLSECCFAIEKIDFQNNQVSEVSRGCGVHLQPKQSAVDLRQHSQTTTLNQDLNSPLIFNSSQFSSANWSLASLRDAIQHTTPLFLDLAKTALRTGSIVIENSHFIQPPVNPLRSLRSRIKQISTPLDIPSRTIEMRSKSAGTPRQSMDAYWQYYEDCDRWDVQFQSLVPRENTEMTHSANRRLSLPGCAPSGYDSRPVRCLPELRNEAKDLWLFHEDSFRRGRTSSFRLTVLARLYLHPAIQPIQRYLSSIQFDWLSQPLIEAWQTAEFWVVETNFAGMIKPVWNISTAGDKLRSEIK